MCICFAPGVSFRALSGHEYLLRYQDVKPSHFSPQAVKNAVGALSSLSPNKLLPRVISHVTEALSRPALCHVTKEEYAIMLTPDGELYDNSIIQR